MLEGIVIRTNEWKERIDFNGEQEKLKADFILEVFRKYEPTIEKYVCENKLSVSQVYDIVSGMILDSSSGASLHLEKETGFKIDEVRDLLPARLGYFSVSEDIDPEMEFFQCTLNPTERYVRDYIVFVGKRQG